MLSYIYQLAYRFEHDRDLRPNALYLNREHFTRLCNEFADPEDIGAISSYLGMHIVLTQEAQHPYLAYLCRSWQPTMATWYPQQITDEQSARH